MSGQARSTRAGSARPCGRTAGRSPPARQPVGAENPVMSCDLHVIVYEPQSRSRRGAERSRRGAGECGLRAGADGATGGAVGVVAREEFLQHCREVARSVIRRWSRLSRRRVAMKRSAIAFARGAGTRVRMIRMSAPANTASKAAVNVLSRSRIKNRNRLVRSPRSMSKIAGLLGHPGSGGMGGAPGVVHAAGGMLDHDEQVEAAQEDGVDVGEIDREDRLGLRRQELSPARAGPVRSEIGVDSSSRSSTRLRRRPVAESDERTLDASVVPG
jgi:hypothetical protein